MATERWCTRCRKRAPDAGKKYCPRCAEANRIYRARKAAENPVGVCSRCKVRPNTLGFKQCEPCRVYVAKAMALHRARDPEGSRAYLRSFVAGRRRQVIEHYGGKCACCGESEPLFLELDHINGGGDAHRREIGSGNTFGWAIQNGFPPIFRVLCGNCHLAITKTGVCPHTL